MGSIKLKHTSGNGTIIHSPAANPSSDVTLKLPSTTGSAGQVLKVASANHSSTNAELEFAADTSGKFESYAIIADQKANGTESGTFTSGDWRTRDLNTELRDIDGIVSISSNQFTLAAGSYLVKASAPGKRVNIHQIRLQNITDSTTVEYGTCEQAYGGSSYIVTRSFLSAQFTISASKVFEIQHRCDTTASNTGFGQDVTFGNVEVYTLVEIYKEV